jgi:hypothetical protein
MMFVVLATLCEAAWETGKMLFQEGKFSWDRLGALFIAEVVAVLTGADIFAALGYPLKIEIVGVLLTGLLMSRGANFIHELYTGLQGLSTKVGLNNKDMQRYLASISKPPIKPDAVNETTVTVDPIVTPNKTVPDDGKGYSTNPMQCTYDEAQIVNNKNAD